MAEIWGAAIVAGGAIAGGVISSQGAKKASKAAAAGDAAAIAEQRRQFDLTRSDTAPYRAIGSQVLNALGSIYGYQPAENYFGPSGPTGTPFSASLPQAAVPGGSLNIGGQLTQRLGGLGKILDPAASIFGSKHGDERRNLKAFMADNQLTDLGNGLVALPDGRTFGKDQLQAVAGAYYGARYHPDGNQADWQSRYDALLTAPQAANVGQAGGGLTSDGVPMGVQNGTPVASQPLTAPDYSAFFKSPDYEFRRSEGTRGIENTFSAAGGAKSGNALRALADYNSNLAAGEFGNYFNRQAALAGIGQTATGQVTSAGAATSSNISNLLSSQGNARASGIAGQYDAWGNALSGIGAGLGYYFGNRRPYGG
jgi:hypothetical protein